jgi:alpha-D-xyloside xylohydrolase
MTTPRTSVLVAVLALWPAVLLCAADAAGPGVAEVRTATHVVRVQFFAEDVVRVQKWPAAQGSSERGSLAVVMTPPVTPVARSEETQAALSLISTRVRVRIGKQDGVVSFETPAGGTILAEARPPVFTPVTTPLDKALSVRQDFRLTAEEGLYGLGQHQDSVMNYRGRSLTLAQSNTDAVTPMLVSTGGWGIYWDNYSKTVFEDGPSGASFWSDVADGVDYYFFYGPSIDAVIGGYRRLTGQAPLYARSAYGYWQSKEHYHTQQELLQVAEEYRRRGIPIDNMVQDWNYWGDASRWSGMVFDPVRYPRPEEMVERLHQLHYRLMISIWPGLGPDTEIYREMEARGFLYPPVGWAGFKYYDAFDPEANAVYWKHLKQGILAKGIDALWIDSTEPDVVNALSKESHEYEMKKVGRNHLGSWARYLNPYSLVMTDALYRNLRREDEARRVFMLTRSAFAGQQRSGATTWSGDIGASWEIFSKQIAAGVNFSMAGLPYWTFDIGGFVISSYGGSFSNGGKDPAYQELYTRMFQFGAFCPIFRAHGSETPREIWEFGPFSQTLVKFDRLRYRLLPYIYSLAWQVTSAGGTLLRGLPMDFASDARTYGVADQFLFGPAFLVSPVTAYQLHRPPEPSVLVPPERFRTPDGRPGLLARYYKDAHYGALGLERVDPNVDVFWYTGRPDFVTDQALSIRWQGRLVPEQTGLHQFHIKAFGSRRMFLDGRELPLVSQSTEIYTEKVPLEAGREYAIKVELENTTSGALRMQLCWKTPDVLAREKLVEPRAKTRPVYLPAGASFFDFWTGARAEGGQTITADAPIETMPLFVRAGSIVPFGPSLQYATERPADPLELRVYPGADGSFTLYEDENDGYAYEKGIYATIDVRWDDAHRQLVLGERKGEFPGMLRSRRFQVVLVSPGHGVGVEAEEHPDAVVVYDGRRRVVTLTSGRGASPASPSRRD